MPESYPRLPDQNFRGLSISTLKNHTRCLKCAAEIENISLKVKAEQVGSCNYHAVCCERNVCVPGGHGREERLILPWERMFQERVTEEGTFKLNLKGQIGVCQIRQSG